MAAVLSTRKLSESQRSLLLNAGLSLVEQDFISISPVDFQLKELPQHIIFTSKNALRVVMQSEYADALHSRKIFCVGDKTAALLREYGLEAVETANYGASLAQIITENHASAAFLHFCGRKRRPEISDTLRQHGIPLEQVIVYDTHATPKKIHRIFDGVLFYSPSAVESFCSENRLGDSIAFCIGSTTAAAARKHTSRIKEASKPSIENVIVQAVKHFRQAGPKETN